MPPATHARISADSCASSAVRPTNGGAAPASLRAPSASSRHASTGRSRPLMASAGSGVHVASRSDRVVDGAVEHDLAGPGDADKTRGEVHRRPDDRVGAVGRRPRRHSRQPRLRRCRRARQACGQRVRPRRASRAGSRRRRAPRARVRRRARPARRRSPSPRRRCACRCGRRSARQSRRRCRSSARATRGCLRGRAPARAACSRRGRRTAR